MCAYGRKILRSYSRIIPYLRVSTRSPPSRRAEPILTNRSKPPGEKDSTIQKTGPRHKKYVLGGKAPRQKPQIHRPTYFLSPANNTKEQKGNVSPQGPNASESGCCGFSTRSEVESNTSETNSVLGEDRQPQEKRLTIMRGCGRHSKTEISGVVVWLNPRVYHHTASARDG